MSGGRLVVLDRLGRDMKVYPLEEGMATIGSDHKCDIRIMLPTVVSPHHATVVVHANQTVLRSVSGETLVNGAAVSVSALAHRDVLTVGGRALRWEYSQPARPRAPALCGLPGLPEIPRRANRSRAKRRGTLPLGESVIVPSQRASMPASTSGKQVAIVQPQRRDTSEQNADSRPGAKRGRPSRNDEQDSTQYQTEVSNRKSSARSSLKSTSMHEAQSMLFLPSSARKSSARSSPKNLSLQETTKATLWIESRKTPRNKSTPLRLAVLRKAQNVHKDRVMKIQAPATIDHTKQAALMLMTGHTPKAKPSPKPVKRPSYVVKKPSPVRKTPRKSKKSTSPIGVTPRRSSTFSRSTRKSGRSPGNKTAVILDVTDSDATTRDSSGSRRATRKTSDIHSPALTNPKKSALKDPTAKKSSRKTESIKFDLSNLESNAQDRSSDVLFVADTTRERSNKSVSEDDITLHYSDTSNNSPSPRKSIHSRSSRILEKSIGTTFAHTPSLEQSTLTPQSPGSRKSSRGSFIVQKALESPVSETSRYSRRSTKTVSDQSYSTTITSLRKTRTISPRSSNQNLESYSIVDLVSIESNDSSQSVYNSAGSDSTVTFDTPRTVASRKTRSTNPSLSLLGSSTPYANRTQSSPKNITKDSPELSTRSSRSSKSRNSKVSLRRSASLTTPENSKKNITFNSTRISRASRSKSRINDSDILLLDDEDDSPKSSRRPSKMSHGTPIVSKNISITASESPTSGIITPVNRHSPVDVGTPILSIQSLLDQSSLSQSSIASQTSQKPRGSLKRKTYGGNISASKRPRTSIKSRSLVLTSRRSLRARKSSNNSLHPEDQALNDEETVTPKSAVKLVQEGVKNKHSTAKKPQSKRSIIDNLNESDIVKQLFNSPVKRKLSQSMTEFSRKQLFEDDDIVTTRPTRNTIALTGRTPDNSFMDHTEAYTPDNFVSPLSTPGNSPNLSGVKRLFRKNTPDNDLRNVKGVKGLLRTPRTRKSIKNDLTNISGVKEMLTKRSPQNRLSDVRVKAVFAQSPRNDLRRVSGVKSLFQSERSRRSPKNTLEDVRGVRTLFQESPKNDLRNVSGVKQTLRVKSPRNDLTDVRGVKQLYREREPRNNLSGVSGIEELFYEPSNLDSTFDQLIGKPVVRSYTKSKSFTKVVKPTKKLRKAKSLHDSISFITENVEEWLENEIKKRVNKANASARKSLNKSASKSNISRALQKLTTDTVEGGDPIRTSRARNSTLTKTINSDLPERKKSASDVYSAHTLPIKKRSLVDASVNKSGDESKHRLPIKKRVVVHSTPVKGRVNMTLNASELGRVSPIALVDKTREVDTAARIPQAPKESPKPKPTRGKKSQNPQISEPEVQKTSPKKTRATNIAQNSPAPVRATRGRKTKETSVANTKKRRSSIVITKKPPVLSPKATSNMSKNQTVEVKNVTASPKKTRATRQKAQVEAKAKTPKNTRAKVQKATVVVSKPSPLIKPRATRRAKETTELEAEKTVEPQITRRTRKITDKENISDVKNKENATEPKTRQKKSEPAVESQVKPKRGRKPAAKTEAQTKDAKADTPVAPVKRGRRIAEETVETEKVQEKKPRKEAKTKAAAKQVSVESEPVKSTRGRQKKETTVIPETNKRQRKITIVESNDKKLTKAKSADEVEPRKSRRGTKAVEIEEIAPKRAARKAKNDTNNSVSNKKATRGSKKSVEVASEVVTAKRASKKSAVNKSEMENKSEAIANKRGGKKSAANKSEAEKSAVEVTRGRKSKKAVEISTNQSKDEGKKTRNAVQKENETKTTTRGKKAAAPAPQESKPVSRKRKNIVEEPPTKDTAQPAAKRRRAPSPTKPSPKAPGRSRRAAAPRPRSQQRAR